MRHLLYGIALFSFIAFLWIWRWQRNRRRWLVGYWRDDRDERDGHD